MLTINLVLALVFTLYLFATQRTNTKQRILAKFIVTEAYVNGIDQSTIYVSNKAYFAFYKTGDEPLSLTGVIGDAEHQAFGNVSYVIAKRVKATQSKEPTDTQSFTWDYENTFDGSRNSAEVKFVKTYTADKVEFELMIETQDSSSLKFKGYMGDNAMLLK